MPHSNSDTGSLHNRRFLWGDFDPVHFKHPPVLEGLDSFSKCLLAFTKLNSIVVDVISVRRGQTRRSDLRVGKRLALLTSEKAPNGFISRPPNEEHGRDNSSRRLPSSPTGTLSGVGISSHLPNAAPQTFTIIRMYLCPNPPNRWNFPRIRPLNASGRLVYERPANYGIGW